MKITDFEIYTFFAFALEFCVESLISLGDGTGRGIRDSLLTCCSTSAQQVAIKYEMLVSKINVGTHVKSTWI